MPAWSNKCASDPRSSKELVEVHRQELESGGDSRKAMAVLHFRGGRQEFEIGRGLTESEHPGDRSIGADLLAQLGGSDRTFLVESVDILIRLLKDPDPHVVYCAAVGLGHRGDARATPHLAGLVDHQDPRVRFGVAFGLSGLKDPQAVSPLIRLSRDSDRETRNWAMFGLGTLSDMDGPEIRNALVQGLNDSDDEIRGEALVGLARRKDPRVVDALLKEWALEEISILSLEAAELLEDPTLVPYLNALKAARDFSDDELFAGQLDNAVMACQGKAPGGTGSKPA